MIDETPTEAATPTPAKVAETPVTEAAAAPAVETPAEETKPEVAAAEEPKPDEPPPSWAEVRDPYDLLELPDLQPHLQRRDMRVEEGLRQTYRQQLETATKDWEAHQVQQQLSGYIGNILKAVEDADAETANKLLDRLERAAEPYSEPYMKRLQAQGADSVGQQFLGVLRDSLPRRGQDELMDYINSHGRASWDEIVKERDRLRDDGSHKPLEEKVTSLTAANEELKRRVGGGPDITPKGGGGTGDDNALLLDANTPTEKLREIRDRQKLAG